jgi:hypothetical protein
MNLRRWDVSVTARRAGRPDRPLVFAAGKDTCALRFDYPSGCHSSRFRHFCLDPTDGCLLERAIQFPVSHALSCHIFQSGKGHFGTLYRRAAVNPDRFVSRVGPRSQSSPYCRRVSGGARTDRLDNWENLQRFCSAAPMPRCHDDNWSQPIRARRIRN